jgi:hypothetical protein
MGAAAPGLPRGGGAVAFFRRYWSKAVFAWLSASPGADALVVGGVPGAVLVGLGIVVLSPEKP